MIREYRLRAHLYACLDARDQVVMPCETQVSSNTCACSASALELSSPLTVVASAYMKFNQKPIRLSRAGSVLNLWVAADESVLVILIGYYDVEIKTFSRGHFHIEFGFGGLPDKF